MPSSSIRLVPALLFLVSAGLAGCSTNTKDVSEVARARGEASGGAPVAQGPSSGAPPAQGASGTSADDPYHVSAAGLRLRIPEGWVKETPDSRMRAAQFRLPPPQPGLEPGEVTIFHFGPGGGGGTQENLVRWANQFLQEDGADPVTRAKVDEFEAGQLKFSTIELEGRYQASAMMAGGRDYDKPHWRLLAAVIEGPGGPWFVKGVGPDAVMLAHRDAFMTFLESASL